MNKTVLITGCSSGFGRATAQFFSRNGWNVVATMRDVSSAGELMAQPNTLVTRLDVQDRASVGEAIEHAISRFGRIDVLINNAGFGLHGIFETTTSEKIQEQFDVNVFGAMNVTRALLPHFRANRAGVIVNVSSGAGVFTLPLISLYCASKFALEGFSEALTYEVAPLGITVKIVEPGGSLSTNFGKRSGTEAAATVIDSDYDPIISDAGKRFQGLAEIATATADDVAAVIYGAATDGTEQLRYVATKDIEPWVRSRRETSEAEYIKTMRHAFMSHPVSGS
ncbi:short-chain dehydrogenase/reductase [Pseudomonas aeruginosa]|uniref:SDR family oxidoreductase n=1 Tax=Pseudomonas aeruginosa TaxID=287 RepID=UPI00071B3823|nr:SDR family oxidoreductase [Pseudomonas aeruginosa]KSJ03929.1 short-chain dehydrogenase/reductase [Pseudomonas aeruginosa]